MLFELVHLPRAVHLNKVFAAAAFKPFLVGLDARETAFLGLHFQQQLILACHFLPYSVNLLTIFALPVSLAFDAQLRIFMGA